MQVTEAGRKSIQSLEGLRLEAYPDGQSSDGAPKYSIGYGHSGAKKGDRITHQQAETLFLTDLAERERAVSAAVAQHVTTQGQFDVLVSLAYNIGLPAFQSSTLLRMHNVGDFAGAAAQFARWIHSAGAVDPRLVARRKLEADLYRVASPQSPQLAPQPADPLDVATAGGVGVGLLFFCPSCSSQCVARFSVARAERCSSQADHCGTVVRCEKLAKHGGEHCNDRIVWTDARALPGVSA